MKIKIISIIIIIALVTLTTITLTISSQTTIDEHDNLTQSSHEANFRNNFVQSILHFFSYLDNIFSKNYFDILEKIIDQSSLSSSTFSSDSNQNQFSVLPIEIEKTDNITYNQIVNPGEKINYTISVKNPDSNDIQSKVHIIDQLPDEVEYFSTDETGLYYDENEHFTYIIYPQLQPDEKKSMNITVTVIDTITHPCMINNTAKVNSSKLAFNSTYERTAIGSYEFSPLQIQKDDRTEEGWVRKPTITEPIFINYSINVTNQHPHDVHNIIIRDKLSDSVEFQAASHDGSTSDINGHIYVFWGFDYLQANTSKLVWVNVSLNNSVTPGSKIINNVYVVCEENCYEEGNDEEETLVVENNPPVTNLSIGDPQYNDENDIFITSHTPLTLRAYDNETYWTGVKTLTYEIRKQGLLIQKQSINDGDNADEDPRVGFIETTIYLEDTCNNTITYYSTDTFNTEPSKTTILQVINTPPSLDIVMGEPKIPFFYEIDGICYPALSAETPITIITSCTQSCEKYIDLEKLSIEIYHGESYGEWELYSSNIIIDNDEHDENSTEGIIEISMKFQDNCWYQIHVWSMDKLGNRNPDQAQVMIKDVYIDAEGPQSEYWYTGPEHQNAFRWITNETTLHVESIDRGCNNQGTGINKTEYWIMKKEGSNWVETYRNIIFDNSDKDYNDDIGAIHIQIQINESCEHYIYYQSTDNIGNQETIHKYYVRVDNHPPLSSLHVEEPSCDYYNEDKKIYCATTETNININAQDQLDPCAVGIDYIEYEIYQNNQLIQKETTHDLETVSFRFNEQCSHTLKYRAVDFLGNIELWNIQEFKIDNQKPSIYLTVGQPNIRTNNDQPHYWITTNTNISIDGYNDGSCPQWTLQYRINNEEWTDITSPLERPYVINLTNECKYTLEVKAFDCIGNTNQLIKRFYVDDTQPDYQIIKPHNGVYTNGDTFHATYHTIDESSFSPPCYENHAVGIPNHAISEAWIIDILPTLMVCELDTTSFTYKQNSEEFDGDITIPIDCDIPDGSAYFVGGSADALGNGKGQIKDKIINYYQKYGQDSTQLQSLLDQLIDEQKIVQIVIDNTPPEEPDSDPPIVSIINPAENEIITSEIIHIQINSFDDKTNVEDLFVVVEITIPGYHQFLKSVTYNETTTYFDMEFNATATKNNSQIQIQAYATDSDGKTGVSNPVSCIIKNNVYFSQWLHTGWNLLDLENVIGNTSVKSVFRSIDNEYKIIFELQSEQYFILGQQFNTLTHIKPWEKYWIKMKVGTGFYLKE